ncbi:1-acyl-sn-glycerol-3-phosphate acyltransferase [Candidatus Woesearchaeota archaeon]|nr:1-acyl-sn-glycerol-3-phosphate acyltransferase [Candidatus Woesearchaeota archaeon]
MAYPITKLWLIPLLRILIRKIEGIENIPASGSFIIASNHEKIIDSFFIWYAIVSKLNRKVHFIARPTNKLEKIFPKQWVGWILVFDRKKGYAEALERLNSGGIIGIYPEGSTKIKKKLKTGAIRLAIGSNRPILPVGLNSSWKPFTSTIRIGNPFYADRHADIHVQTKNLMKKIYRLKNSFS